MFSTDVLVAMALAFGATYLLGSLNFAVIVSRLLYHDDVRNYGSGNAGMTNMLRTYGKKAAFLTGLGDFFKGCAAVFIARGIFSLLGAELTFDGGWLGAIGALIGHLFPLYFHFKGGKGILAACGAILVMNPDLFLVLFVCFVPIAFITRIVSLASVGRMPDLAPQLIHGVMRDGQKGMLVGPSKAGKSFALIELAIAVARGWEWMGHCCAQGRVLYVNMEIQQPSFYHRMADSYAAAKRLRGEDVAEDRASLLRELSGVDVWCLRGHVAPMDRLTPMLVRKAQDRGYRLVIIDPIYKVLTGDENSASDMANFTNQFDVIAESLKCAVFYAHHHAKGDAGRRGAIDRASGSGVFARDPDAMLDMSPIAVPSDMRDRLAYHVTGADGTDHERHASAYRVSYTLREFETPPPRDVLFEWPLHVVTDKLSECRVVGEAPTQSELTAAANEARRSAADDRWAAINDLVAEAIGTLSESGNAPTSAAVYNWLSAMRSDELREHDITKDKLDKWASPSNKKRRSARFRYHKRERPDGIVVLAED